jgi:hypothetical protein
MAVAMRDKWTDERLDDLNAKVDDGFRRVDERFNRVDERFIHLERTMNQWFMALVTLMLTGFAGLAGLIVTQT